MMLIDALDMIGTFVFALSGGSRAVEKRLDIFGVLFLAFVAAVSGGILRDVMVGATPATAIATWHYLAISTLAGLCCFLFYSQIARLEASVSVFDAIGLGLFAVTGTQKALSAGIPPVMAAVLGMLTAIGGGIARDVLTTRTPMVLQKEIYAVAALLGAVIVAFGGAVGMPSHVTAVLGALLTISLRLISLRNNWHFPRSAPE